MKKKRSHAFKTSKRRSRSSLYFIIAIFTFVIIFLGYEYFSLKRENSSLKRDLREKELQILSLKDLLKKEKTKNMKLSQEIDRENRDYKASEAEDYLYSLNFSLVKLPPLKEKKVFSSHSNKKKVPKLAIILDDIAFKRDVENIKALPFRITPSFFPPSKRHPKTSFYARKFKTYMIHLPLEAYRFARVETNTLDVNDTLEEIDERIKEIRYFFPNAKFINNHTGSKFTSNKSAMKKLLYSLKKYHFYFLDSKTAPHSQAEAVAKELNLTVLSRDVFLDNIGDVNYIKNQLKEAVRIAKKRGYAIAIGHPRKATFEALKKSKDILKDVRVVYIDQLYKNR